MEWNGMKGMESMDGWMRDDLTSNVFSSITIPIA
jgi:hypothetical protein